MNLLLRNSSTRHSSSAAAEANGSRVQQIHICVQPIDSAC